VAIELAGLGNAIMDALVRIDDDSVLSELGVPRGQMTLVDHHRWHAVYDRLHGAGVEVHSGGSCANTIATAALCGARTAYCGQVADDRFGELYHQSLSAAGAQVSLRVVQGAVSGKCLSLVSRRDGERTMLTDLGVAGQLGVLGDFWETLGSARIIHLEGYLFLPGPSREVAWAAVRAARAAGVRISFDCADPFVAHAIRDDVETLLREYVSVAFLNREEAEAVTGMGAYPASERLGEWVEWAVVKLGGEGSLVRHAGHTHHIRVFPTEVRDTTGAGDAYAGGFLYGWLRGWTPDRCGELGSRVAALTVGQMGAVCRDRAAMAAARDATEAG